MEHDTVPYDEAIWAIDEAIVRARSADPAGVTRLLSGAIVMVDRAPYSALVRDARQFGSDAARAMRDGDVDRTVDFLVLLRRVVEDMDRLGATAPAPARGR